MSEGPFSWLRVHRLGFMVSWLRFMVWGSGFLVSVSFGFWFRVRGSGLRGWDEWFMVYG